LHRQTEIKIPPESDKSSGIEEEEVEVVVEEEEEEVRVDLSKLTSVRRVLGRGRARRKSQYSS
jgi:hypothetical protein